MLPKGAEANVKAKANSLLETLNSATTVKLTKIVNSAVKLTKAAKLRSSVHLDKEAIVMVIVLATLTSAVN